NDSSQAYHTPCLLRRLGGGGLLLLGLFLVGLELGRAAGLLLGLLGGFLGVRGGFFGGSLLLHPLHRQNRALVEKQQRQRKRQLAQYVRWREHGRDHEGADHEIAPLLLELLRGEDADAAEQRQDHRQLERDAE